LKVHGLTEKSKAKPFLGFSDTETVMLDFDDTTSKTVKYLASRAVKWFKLGGYMILKSSKGCYHAVFNRPVSWSENMRIVAWVALQSHNKGLQKWFIMQCIKQSSTLRVSNKLGKPSPRVVFRFGRQDLQINNFIRNRHLIKTIIRKL
jgi:hypothetical protein